MSHYDRKSYLDSKKNTERLLLTITTSVAALDYSAYLAQMALEDDNARADGREVSGERMSLEEHTQNHPGPNLRALRAVAQELLEMLLSRFVDDFQTYLPRPDNQRGN